MIRRHGVLLTVLFALILTLVSVSIIFFEFYKLNKQQYIDHIFTKYAVIIQIYKENQRRQNSNVLLDANLAVYKLFLIKDKKDTAEILQDAIILKEEGIKSLKSTIMLGPEGLYRKNTVASLNATMLQKANTVYFQIQTPVGSILIKDEVLEPYNYLNLMYAYSTIFTIITLSFVMILQRLRPLIRLRKKIALFGDGDMKISFRANSSDEIGLVSNELESARKKIDTLLTSRTLFLRNLMHELKTPIAKGTIATQMLDSEKQKKRFTSIFSRLEALVTEFALIEEVTSIDDKNEFKEYRLVDVIDGAIDMAMVEREKVYVEVTGDIKLTLNYRLYTTAIKNMIDNAMKYSPNQKIKILMMHNELCFENSGEKLSHPLYYYIEPFTKSNPSKNSFGLGLYLVDSVLKSHNQVLAYEYENGINRFIFALVQ